MQTSTRSRRLGRLVAVAGAVALSASVAGAAGTPVLAAPTAATGPDTVLLPTGEHLTVRWAGDRPQLSRQAGDHTRFTTFTAGGRTYAVPAEAMPYLDRTLDRSLFDVAALAAAEKPAGRVPLAVTGDATVPGAHATGTSTGWLDRSGATTFGTALRDRIRRNPAGARTGAAVPGLTRLALAGAPAPGTVHPDYPMYTLTVTLTPPAGQTVLNAAALIVNTDDSREYSGFTGLAGNLAKVSVPAGHYAIVGSVETAAPDGSFGTSYQPIDADYTVTGGGQTVALDANQATAEPTFTTPTATTMDFALAEIDPTDGVHEGSGLGIIYGNEDDVLMQPIAKPAHGVFEFDTVEHRTDTSGADWDVTADWPNGIPANLNRTIRPGDLATVHDRVFADGATGDTSYGFGPVYADLRGVQTNAAPIPATSHTTYLYGPSYVRWVADVYRATDAAQDGGEYLYGTPQSYPAGRAYQVNWFQESLAPGFAPGETFPRPYCVACRTGDQLSLMMPTELDAVAGHNGAVYGDATGWARLRVFQDGTSIADATDDNASQLEVPVPADGHGYRIESTVDRSVLGLTSATHTTAVYTVDSSATSGAALPDGWDCPAADFGGTGACTILPLLTTTVPLPTRQDGTIEAGASTFTVNVGHLAGATASAVTALTVDTAIGTAGYTPAKVRALGNGGYQVTVVLPASQAGAPVALRVHAEDAAGGTLTQTVTAAATIAA